VIADTGSPILLDATWAQGANLLSQEAGWNQVAADWSIFFTRGTVFGFIAGDRLVATAAALPFGDDLGWISMVLVTPEWRRRGLASRLVAACISALRDSGRAALLDAAPAATNIYASLGFVPLCSMTRWEGEGRGDGNSPTSPNGALKEFAAQDRIAFGADRRFLLEDFLSRPGSFLFQRARSFAMLRQGHITSQLGPILGEPTQAAAMVADAIHAASGRMVIDVLDAGNEIIPKLEEMGFRSQRSFTRMALDLKVLPGTPTQVLAAAGPEFG